MKSEKIIRSIVRTANEKKSKIARIKDLITGNYVEVEVTPNANKPFLDVKSKKAYSYTELKSLSLSGQSVYIVGEDAIKEYINNLEKEF